MCSWLSLSRLSVFSADVNVLFVVSLFIAVESVLKPVGSNTSEDHVLNYLVS